MIKPTGGKNMSAARTFCILISLMALLVITFYAGCSPDRSGTATENSKPEIHVVNTPPDGAQFSRNPDLNWYATDIDGYITFYRYAVVVDSMLLINGQHVTPEVFVEQATDEQFGWIKLDVTLDETQATATVRLFANTEFPVDSFVTQYFFVQACDDMGAMSDIVWRMYSRNNHFPNTHFRAQSFYINAKDASSPAPGISLNWSGADSTDWGRAEPPLEFEWRLYGPFEEDAIINVNMIPENCIYDPTVGEFVNCIDVPILDLDNLPAALNDMPQPLIHSQGPNFANDPSDVWVTETQTSIYDVYETLNLTSTSKYKFVFWVRARDDGFVPDPTPKFAQFNVFEAMFENSVMVIDETGYTTVLGRWGPYSMDTVKSYFYDMLNTTLGYSDFDTIYHQDDSSGPEDYFYSTTKKNYWRDNCPLVQFTFNQPALIDVLSHRVIIYFNDDAESGPNDGAFGFLGLMMQGMDMGASGWLISRNLGNATINGSVRGDNMGKTLEFAGRFGISEVVAEAWLHYLLSSQYYLLNPQFNEEFIGAYANIEGFPNIMADIGEGSLMERYYPRFFSDADHILVGQPEIGVGTRTAFAAPLYLYLSKDGDQSMFHGKVMSVLQQVGDMRSACFMFTPMAMDPGPMQEVFETIMPWLMAKFEDGAKSSQLDVPAYDNGFSSISERKARLQRFLDYMSEEASDEERASFGMEKPKPYVVIPVSDGQ